VAAEGGVCCTSHHSLFVQCKSFYHLLLFASRTVRRQIWLKTGLPLKCSEFSNSPDRTVIHNITSRPISQQFGFSKGSKDTATESTKIALFDHPTVTSDDPANLWRTQLSACGRSTCAWRATPLSFDVSFLQNPCGHPHCLYIARNQSHWSTWQLPQYWSICIYFYAIIVFESQEKMSRTSVNARPHCPLTSYF